MKAYKNDPPKTAVPLSYREKVVLELLVQRKTIAEIAEAIMLVPLSVKSLLKNIKRKLNLSTRAELVNYAIEQNLI